MNLKKTKTHEDIKSRIKSNLPLIIIIFLGIWFVVNASKSSLLASGTKAPAFSVPLIHPDGDTLNLDELSGKVVVLDFWSITCAPCRKQFGELAKIRLRTSENKVAMLALEVGGFKKEEIKEFILRHPVSYMFAKGDDKIANSYKVTTLPTIYILNPKGQVAYAFSGFTPADTIFNAIAKVAK